ncbi:hypothetical protein DORLON_01333 [Dorea longicatena DSM 13814]|uniref:Uncharacterized protein n=1 Tax=Dorea longicatena DSM 13814 TaxID=411462 RepID=A6BGB1_9FIRM|nr:hypothetical protein DORLON_01333 [Dorea longicatena DSM 13814]
MDSAEFRFCTIQLSLKNSHLLENGFEYRSAFRHSCGFLLSFFRGLRHDQIQDFFGERNNHASGQCQKSICPLAWIMAFQGQSYLHHSKSKQNQADGTNQREDECRQVIDNGQRISGCECGRCSDRYGQYQCHIKTHPLFLFSPHRHRGCHFFSCILFCSIFFSCEKFLQYTSLQSIKKLLFTKNVLGRQQFVVV